jgi:hypothetical protein
MTGAEGHLKKEVSKAFLVLLLLTGSVAQSEEALLESIQRLDLSDNAPAEKLMQYAFEAVSGRLRNNVEDCAVSLLPPELESVLRLPSDLRGCFTLRVLAGLPGEICASLLDLETSQLEEAVGAAATILAGIPP